MSGGAKKPYPFKWVEIPMEEVEERRKIFTSPISHEVEMVKSEPGGIYMPKKFAQMAEDLYNMEVRPSDVWVVTYPKCGTTWTQELVWQVVHNVDLSEDKAPAMERVPFVEMSCLDARPLMEKGAKEVPEVYLLGPDGKPDPNPRMSPRYMANTIAFTEELDSPRVIKTHMPFEFLPPNLLDVAKVVYVCRNPRDVCVSYYHHCKTLGPAYGLEGSFDDYMDLFLKGQLAFGDYWYHLKSGFARKDHSNMMFLWYEDMKKDLISVIKDVSKFTGYHLTQYKVLLLDDHLYIDNFRKAAMAEQKRDEEKEMMKNFVRKGAVGDWKYHIRTEKMELWNRWIEENTEGTQLPKFKV